MDSSREMVGPLLNVGADGFRVALAQGVAREMIGDGLAGAIWDAAVALEKSRPGRWDGNDLLAAVNTADFDALAALMNASVVAYPLDTIQAAARRVVEAHGRRRTLDALAEVRDRMERGDDDGEAWGRLVEARATAGRPARLSFMDAGEILDAKLPPKVYHVFPWLAAGSLSALVGAGGTGKSRFVLFALACVIAGKRTVGSLEIPGGSAGGRWLVVGGNENDVYRYRADLEELAQAFPSAVPQLRRRLVFQVYRDGDKLLDADALPDVEEKVRELGDVEGVVFDPLSDFAPPGESLNDDKIMKALCVRLRDGIKRVAPSACVLLVHHARGGRDAAGKAVDVFEAGEVGRNSKMLAATCRCVLNLVPFDEAGGVVGFVGKCNDARKPPPFALRKVPGEGYEAVEGFDVATWLAEVVGKHGAGGGARGPAPQYSDDGRGELGEYFQDDTPMKVADLVKLAGEKGMGRRRVYECLGRALNAGWLVEVRRGVYRRAE